MDSFIIDGVKVNISDIETERDVALMNNVYDFNEMPDGNTQVIENTELGDSLKELNKDSIEPGRMSGIDMRSRLHYIEVSSILALDALVAFKFLPVDCLAFTRQKKRLAVSLNGKGRDDIVNIVAGKREQEARAGQTLGESFKNLFRGKNNEK